MAVVAPVRLFRDGVARALSAGEGVHIVCTVGSCRELAEWLDGLPVDIVLLDLAASANLEAIAVARTAAPGASVVGLGVVASEPELLAWFEAGLVGYVAREGTFKDLSDTIQAVARGEMLCSPRLVGRVVRRLAVLSVEPGGDPVAASLTAREREIVELIQRGLSNKEIALRLRIELATVKKHVHNVLGKLQVRRRLDVADWASQGKLDLVSTQRRR